MARVKTTAATVSLDRVRVSVAAYLRVEPDTLDVHRPLTAHGIDSLGALELAAHLEDAFHCTLPESLLSEWPTVAGLTAALAGETTDPETALANRRERLLADCQLPDDLRPSLRQRPTPATGNVLVTGATGFLGAWLVRRLMDEGLHVTCLTRVRAGVNPMARVHANLERYGLWRDADASHITAVPSDLTQSRFGLTRSAYDALAGSVDAVYHAAADVNWVSSYEALRATNVAATIELLRFASAVVAKPFHFISSLSVCFADGGPTQISETETMLDHVERLPLGYAQSKCVSEALVRAAARRGLTARIFRPALLAGDSTTGASNVDDLTAALIKGCIQMGTAPDLDWLFDAVPVDTAARAIVDISRAAAGGVETYHLRHPRPRHWRECVLWTNVFGYDVRLERYDDWLRRLAREATAPEHPLHALRGFFGRQLSGRTVPEIYAEHTRSTVDCTVARAREQAIGLVYPAFDAERLDSYFRDYMARGFLMPPDGDGRAGLVTSLGPGMPDLLPMLREHFGDPSLVLTSVELIQRGSEHSIVSELTSWKDHQQTGLFRYRVGLNGTAGARALDIIAKVKASDQHVLDVAETLARTCDVRVHEELMRVRDRLGISGGQRREVEVYRLQRHDARLRAHMPTCYGSWVGDRGASCGVLLEQLTDMALIDSAADTAPWSLPFIDAAIDGLAVIHAAGMDHVPVVAGQSWVGHVQSTASVDAMVPFWAALADHAAPMFARWGAETLPREHARLVRTTDDWWPALDAMPRTLIHHDFNSRNIGIRVTANEPHLVAYDWELATLGAPQRDLAELLCFVLPPDAPQATVSRAIERHRVMLERHSGRSLPSAQWRDGFRSALADLLVARLAFYALVDRVRPQAFLPRVVSTWVRLQTLAAV